MTTMMTRQITVLLTLAALLLVLSGCRGSSDPTPTVSPSPIPSETPTPTVAPTAPPTPLPTATPLPTPTLSPTPTPSASPSPSPTLRPPEFRILTGLVTNVPVPELPEEFAAPVPDSALQELIETTLAEYPGRYSVVVHNLADGRYAALNEQQVYYAASLFKLGLLLEVYRQRDAGEVDLAQILTLTAEHANHDFGTLELLDLQAGDTLTLLDAITAMIVVSDTPTAILVQDVVGTARVDVTLRSLGIEQTSFNVSGLPAVARDIAVLLEAIAAGEGVSEASRHDMLSVLLQERIRQGIPMALPVGTAVAHKTGNWTNATHSVAIVWGPAGPYVIVVMSDQPWTREPVVAVSGAVWDYFANPEAEEE